MQCVGFANHAPDEILALLRVEGFALSDIHMIGNEAPTKLPAHKAAFFFNVNQFYAFYTAGLLQENGLYLVFDQPMNLLRYDLQRGDFKMVADTLHVDGFELINLTKLPKIQHVRGIKKVNFNIVEAATEVAKSHVTFLTQFMTFIYSLPAETHQKPVKELVCNWMVSLKPKSAIEAALAKLRTEIHITDKQIARLLDILDLPATAMYREALQCSGDEDTVAKQMKVSAYEMRYIRAISLKQGQ